MPNNQISVSQISLSSALKDIAPTLRLAIGLFASGLIGLYAPLLLIALTGRWSTSLTNLYLVAVALGILIPQNLLGIKLKRIMAVGVVFAVVLTGSDVLITVLYSHIWTWSLYYPDVILPAGACLLNAFLLLRYKAAVDLE